MLNSFRNRNNCEQEAKFVQDRILSVERDFAELCQVFGRYSRKIARVRDIGDEMAKTLTTYAENEVINKSLSESIEGFSQYMTTISDYGDARVQNIDSKVVQELAKYEDICKQAKEDTKHIFTAREKEMKRKLYLDRLKERNPRNRQQIIQAETELLKATAEVTKSIHSLEEKTTSFEREKIHDVKSILLDFIATEMGYHAKALEHLTSAFQEVSSINEESDTEAFQQVQGEMEAEFMKSLRVPEMIRHGGPKNALFRASHSLGSLGVIFSGNIKKTPGIPRNTKKMSKSVETLSSTKESISDTEISQSNNDEEDEVTEDLTTTEDKMSPIVVKKYLK